MPEEYNLNSTGIQNSTGYFAPLKVIKPETTSRLNTAAFAIDPDLVVPISPFQVMTWKCMLVWGGNSPGNAQAQFTTPAAPGQGGFHFKYYDAAAALQNGIATLIGAYNLAVNMLVNGGANSVEIALFEGYLVNGANGGYFSVDWAQNGVNATPTLLQKGSYLEAWFQ